MNGIQIMTDEGWKTISGTALPPVTANTLPDHQKCPPTVTTARWGMDDDWFRTIGERNLAFNVRQAELLNSIAA